MVRTGACSKVNEEFLLALGSRNNFFERMFVETTGAPQQQEQEHPPATETSLTQTRTATNTLPSLAGTTWTVEWATHGHLSRLLVITATFLGHEVELWSNEDRGEAHPAVLAHLHRSSLAACKA